jgi:hypothetical protein
VYCHLQTHGHGPWTGTRRLHHGDRRLLDLLHLAELPLREEAACRSLQPHDR